MTDYEVSLTASDSIAKTQHELNVAMAEFDRWASTNQLLANRNNVEYRTFQQRIKTLKLKIKETKLLSDEYQNTLMVLSATPTVYKDPEIPTNFTRSKDDKIFAKHDNMKLGRRKNGMVSKGGGISSVVNGWNVM